MSTVQRNPTTRRSGRMVPLLAALVLTLAGCGTTGGDDPEEASGSGSGSCEGLRIGVFGALTGPYANLGGNIRNGVQLAVDQHNDGAGACQVEIEEYDSQADQNQAVGLAQQAVQDESVVAVIGPAFSGEAKVGFPVMQEGGLVGLTTATNPQLTENGWDNFFRLLSNDATQAPAAVSYLQEAGRSKVYVVDDSSEYGKGLADLVREGLGAGVAGQNTVQTGQTDFSAVVSDIRASGADAVYFGGYYAEAGLLVRQLRAAGLTSDDVLFVTDDAAKDEGLVTAAGDAAEGSVITCPCLPPDAAQGEFPAQYEEAFGAAPGTYSAEAYDGAAILLEGLDAGNTTRASLRDFVASYQGPGVAKEWGWTATGEPTSTSVWSYVVIGGRITTGAEISAG